jgi:hypothetical protein
MPIRYCTEKEGFILENPTKEEVEALERLAVNYITMSLGKMAADSFIASITDTPLMDTRFVSTTTPSKH